MEVYEVTKLESVLKIWVAHFLGALGTNSAQNFGITQEQRVVRAWEPFHHVSRRILHMEAALLRKFCDPRNSQNALTKGNFLGQFYEIVRFCGKSGYGGLWGR